MIALWCWLLCDVIVTLVTEESSPALPTIALPGLRACAVQTSGVPNARVAEVAFVSSPTSKKKFTIILEGPCLRLKRLNRQCHELYH